MQFLLSCSVFGVLTAILQRAYYDWRNQELQAELAKLEKKKEELATIRNNGATGNAIRFFEKMYCMEAIEIALRLGLKAAEVEETFEAIKREFRNFDNA